MTDCSYVATEIMLARMNRRDEERAKQYERRFAYQQRFAGQPMVDIDQVWEELLASLPERKAPA